MARANKAPRPDPLSHAIKRRVHETAKKKERSDKVIIICRNPSTLSNLFSYDIKSKKNDKERMKKNYQHAKARSLMLESVNTPLMGESSVIRI